MSVESEILRIQRNIADTYAAVAEKGGEVPLQPISANLAAAVASIQTGITQEELNAALSTKQNTLTGQPGQVVGFDGMGLAYAVPGWSNPTLLDNWYFADPVNQKGQTEYAKGIGVDRWHADGGMTIEDGYISVNTTLYQIIPPDETSSYLGKRLTLSLLTHDGKLISGTNTIPNQVDPSKNLWTHFIESDGIALGTFVMKDGTMQIFRSSGECGIVAVKAELGPVQTLAHQDADGNWVLNDPPPNKALELARCQRYYQVFATEAFRPTKAADFRPPMRVNPALGAIKIDDVTYYTADANL